MNSKKKNNDREIGWFLLYAFGIPFACIVIMNIIEAYDKTGIITLVLYGIEGASPMLAAIWLSCKNRELVD